MLSALWYLAPSPRSAAACRSPSLGTWLQAAATGHGDMDKPGKGHGGKVFPKSISAKLERSKQDSMLGPHGNLDVRPCANHRNKVAWDRAQPAAGQEGTGARA